MNKPCSHDPSEVLDVLDILTVYQKVKSRCCKCGTVFTRWVVRD